jgi:hypothetical protein
MRKWIPGAMLWSMTTVLVLGAEIWETKPFMTWSENEVKDVLTDSPWSKTVQVVLNSIGRGGGGGIESEGGRGGGGGGGEGGDAESTGGGGGRRGAGSTPILAPQMRLLVSWRSARPMKQALVRNALGLGGIVSSTDQEILERDEDLYVISMSGLPVRFGNAVNAMPAQTLLRRNGKPPIPVLEVGDQQLQNEVIVLFTFSKDDAIRLEDKEVEFVTKVNQFDVKKKFTLKDMVVRGKLEL